MPSSAARAVSVFACAAGMTILAGAASAADLPKSTGEFLKQLKVSDASLAGLDKELSVPQAWIDGARRSPTLRISSSDDPPLHARAVKPFLERYPFVKIVYQRGSANERVIRPLLAFAEGRYLVDVVRSVDGSLSEFIKADAAEKLDYLPTYGSAVPRAHDEGAYAVSFRSRPYCMAYNPDLIKREHLPKTWADLPNTAVLGEGRIGVGMLAHLWFMPLWEKHGETWALKYLDDFFVKLKPQIRREGINASIGLVGAGENYVTLPAYPERIKELQEKGGSIGFYCPDAVPLQFSKLAIFKGSPGIDAARLYVNWLLSKEGQIAQFAVFGTPPVHKDLQGQEFHVFPEEMAGKEIISSYDDAATDKFLDLWKTRAASASR